MATAIETAKDLKGWERVEASTFVLNLTIGVIRTRAKVKREKVQQMAEALREDAPETVEEATADDANEIHVSKELMKVPEIKNLIAELNATRTLLRGSAQPVRFLKGGLYLYAATRVEWAEEKIAEARERIEMLLSRLEPRWDAIIEEDKRRLGPLGLFDARDYPTLSKIREAATVRFSWLRFGTPTELKGINPVLFEAERQKAKEMWTDAFDQIRLTYRETLLQFFAGLREVLKPEEDGKRRVIKQARLDNMMDFLKTYRLQDVTNDTELAELVDRAKNVMRGIDAEELRTYDKARQRVGQEMDALVAEIEPLVIEQQRIIKLRK